MLNVVHAGIKKFGSLITNHTKIEEYYNNSNDVLDIILEGDNSILDISNAKQKTRVTIKGRNSEVIYSKDSIIEIIPEDPNDIIYNENIMEYGPFGWTVTMDTFQLIFIANLMKNRHEDIRNLIPLNDEQRATYKEMLRMMRHDLNVLGNDISYLKELKRDTLKGVHPELTLNDVDSIQSFIQTKSHKCKILQITYCGLKGVPFSKFIHGKNSQQHFHYNLYNMFAVIKQYNKIAKENIKE